MLFKLENDYKRVSFVIFLSRDTLLFVTLVLRFGKNYDFVEIHLSLAEKIPEKQNCNF